MTRTISFIIGIAVVALVAVPTAFGEGRLAGSPEQTGVAYFYANERATLAQQPLQLDRRSDAFDRTVVVGESPYIASEHSVPSGTDVSTYLDANERTTTPVFSNPTVTPTSSGDGVEWPQIGIGFGIGILLAIVLGLSLKATRPRTLAH